MKSIEKRMSEYQIKYPSSPFKEFWREHGNNNKEVMDKLKAQWAGMSNKKGEHKATHQLDSKKKKLLEHVSSIKEHNPEHKEHLTLIEETLKGLLSNSPDYLETYGTYKNIPVSIKVNMLSVDMNHMPFIRGARDSYGAPYEPDEPEHYEVNSFMATAELISLDADGDETDSKVTIDQNEFKNVITEYKTHKRYSKKLDFLDLYDYVTEMIEQHPEDFE